METTHTGTQGKGSPGTEARHTHDTQGFLWLGDLRAYPTGDSVVIELVNGTRRLWASLDRRGASRLARYLVLWITRQLSRDLRALNSNRASIEERIDGILEELSRAETILGETPEEAASSVKRDLTLAYSELRSLEERAGELARRMERLAGTIERLEELAEALNGPPE